MELYQLKPFLHISLDDSDYDSDLTALYTSAKQVFTDMTDIQLSNTPNYTFTYYNGNSLDTIFFSKAPVNSITSVTYRDVFSESMITIDSSDYELFDNTLRLKNSYSFNKMSVVADIGYSTIPGNIDYLLAQVVNHYFNFQANSIHLSSEGNVPLMPNEATMPKFLYSQIKSYRLSI